MAATVSVYDACVLFPPAVRDALMQLAADGLCRARWTDRIHDEWIDAVLRGKPELKDRLARTRPMMDAAVPDALVTGYEHLIPTLELPDADDRHVLAAAIHAEAATIVTFNLKDFPPERLAPHGIVALHPDTLIPALIEERPRRCSRRSRRSARGSSGRPTRHRISSASCANRGCRSRRGCWSGRPEPSDPCSCPPYSSGCTVTARRPGRSMVRRPVSRPSGRRYAYRYWNGLCMPGADAWM